MDESSAKVSRIKKISPVWIIPIITAIIGVILIVSHIRNAGYSITITAVDANGIVGGKTTIKMRSVDVGIVDSVELSPDFKYVTLHCTVHKKMGGVLRKDSQFWVVKPEIGLSGVSGLSTLIAGVHIEVRPGSIEGEMGDSYVMLESPPVAANEEGLKVVVNSTLPDVLVVGTPVEFNGYTVGNVETAAFDIENRRMRYTVFIKRPFDTLLTKNSRFWQKGSADLNVTASGLDVRLPSISDLLTGALGFALPEGAVPGLKADTNDEYSLYPNATSINEAEYTLYREYILLFNTSVGGLSAGAPVEFRGVRVGTVMAAPYIDSFASIAEIGYDIPVLIRIEPERALKYTDNKSPNYEEMDKFFTDSSLRGSLKISNLLTMTLYVDLNIYQNPPQWTGRKEIDGLKVIPTTADGLDQIQYKVMDVLNRIANMPVDETLTEMTAAMRDARHLMDILSEYMASESAQRIPQDIRDTLEELTRTMKGYQSGSDVHKGVVEDLKQVEKTLRAIQPLLDTLNEKSNALIFKANNEPDIIPKAEK